MSAPIHADVASAIGQQVEQMIQQAQKDSEARVRHDLSVARQQLQQMEGLISDLGERVGRCVRNSGVGSQDPSQTVDRSFLNTQIAQLESKWGSEVKALKQDLHRTILAHNHNSDLMRHHRDALDEARRKLDAQTQPKAEQVDSQIEKVDRMLRAGQAKQRALDALTERLTALEQQVGDIVPPAGMAAGYPGMMPGLPGGMPGLPGMGMPPPGMEQEQPKKRAPKKDEPPSEEEVRARLLQASKNAGGETSFNAEAPVFVPRGAASAEATSVTAKPGFPSFIHTGPDPDDVDDAAGDAAEGEVDDADEGEDKEDEAELGA